MQYFRRFLQAVTVLGFLCVIFLFHAQTNMSIISHGTTAFSNIFAEQKPRIDHTKFNESDVMESIQSRLPSFPLAYFNNQKKPKKYPSMYDIQYNNDYWQTLRTSNGTFYLYGAYFDIREHSLLRPSIRIVAVIDRYKPVVQTHCAFWFSDRGDAVTVPYKAYTVVWRDSWSHPIDKYYTFLITCELPMNISKAPDSVSLVETIGAKITNNLHVFYNLPDENKPKKEFAVCVKGLDFQHEDKSVLLVEWIEFLRLLGVDKIFMYQLSVHPNVTKVLDYYSISGFVDVKPLSLPGNQPNLPGLQHKYLAGNVFNKRTNEIIAYNDCLYRNMYRYTYLVSLDTDEAIVPTDPSDYTWSDLIRRVKGKPNWNKGVQYQSLYSRNIHFFDINAASHKPIGDIPKHLYMLQTVYRQSFHEKLTSGAKCFYDPENILTLHNHLPISCLRETCRTFGIPTNQSQLQHYRGGCEKFHSCRNFNESVEDTNILKYKNRLVPRSQQALLDLGFIRDLRDGIEDT